MAGAHQRFIEVKRRLWADISAGRFGNRLPPEPELAKSYDVSRMTLRRAISGLVSEGFLEARPGAGTSVRKERGGDPARTRGSKTIGLLIDANITDAAGDAYFGSFFGALAFKLASEGYMLIHAATPEELVPSTPTIEDRDLRRPVDGVVAVAFDQDAVGSLAKVRAPVVLADSLPVADRSCVITDNLMGATLAVRHLHDLGHRQIAHISGPLSTASGRERFEAWRGEVARLGLPDPDSLHVPGNFQRAKGFDAMGRLCDRPGGPPTAVFCANDRMALGAIQCLASRGLRVPQDVSVVGFDDIDAAELSNPALTTVAVKRLEMASLVCAVLLEDVRGGAPTSGRIIRLPVSLVVRGTTASPR